MTAVGEHVIEHEGDVDPAPSAETDAARTGKGALLARVFELLDHAGVPYIVLHGYQALPAKVDGDVDMLVPAAYLPHRLRCVIAGAEQSLGAKIVQWFEDRAHFIVLCARNADGAPMMLQLHVSSDYEVQNRLIYAGDHVIQSRRRHESGFWIPSGHVEFICVLANRIAKGSLKPTNEKQLSELWKAERDRCGAELFRFFSSDSTRRIADAAEANEWGSVHAALPELRKELMLNGAIRQPTSFVYRVLAQQWNRAKRWANPKSGLHVVFLGPDGVGKSTTIDTVKERVAPAFLEMRYETFARSLLPNKPKASPHALPPRSYPASLLKAAWWMWCYTFGYLHSVHPTRARGGLAINHRYLLDAMIDPKRYRYSGPIGLLKFIWAFAPKPDLIVILHAPPEVIQQRKQETAPEETVRQCAAYKQLAASLPNARLIDTNRPINETVDEVTNLILACSAARAAGRRAI